MKKPELLSPAGNMECLYAAINAGADAIYLGGKLFGARSFAGNFTHEELIDAIKYAHTYGVKIYVTVNTMVYEEEVESFLDYVDFLHKNNVDALIIQDLGMMDLIRKTYPNLELHASTQMNVHNVEGVKFLSDLGLKRVVLARETNIEKIREIKSKVDCELEVFSQGALCLSYSGECLMSSLIGGRSGNRGTCSQCCRMPYDLISDGKIINKNKYLLSTKDLNTLENLPLLIEAGVDSLKIEGRMKRKEYVYLMTKIYRTAIDNYFEGKKLFTKEDIIEMKKMFNREFTKGFLFNESNSNFINSFRPNHIGIKIGEVVGKNRIKLTSDIKQGDGIRIIGTKDTGSILNKIYKNKKLVNAAFIGDIIEIELKDNVVDGIVVLTSSKEQLDRLDKELSISKKIKVNMDIKNEGSSIKVSLTDFKNTVSLEKDIVEKAINSGTSHDRIIEQLTKFGDTPFVINEVTSSLEDNIFVSIKELNNLRRELTNMLIDKRCYKIDYVKNKYSIDLPDYDKTNDYSVLLNDAKDYDLIKKLKLDAIYSEDTIEDSRFVRRIPRVNFDLSDYSDKLLVGDIGALAKYKDFVTDFNFNISNSYAVAFMHSIGASRVTLSYELKPFQIKKIIDKYHERYNKHPNVEVIISSTPEVMISKYDMLKDYNIKEGYLKDSFNNKFKVVSKNNLMTIYNFKKIRFLDDLHQIGVNSLRIHLEDKDDLELLDSLVK